LQDALLALMDLPDAEKDARGLRHTPREIAQQPDSWESTYRRCAQQRAELSSFLKQSGVGSKDASAPIVYLVGAGSSDYIGRAVVDLLRQCWSSLVWTVPSTDLLTNMERMVLSGREYLWISFSRSGDSSEGVAVLEKALAAYPRIRHLIVTCNPAGQMSHLSSENSDKMLALVLDEKVNDQGLAMTSSFSNMVIAGQCLANIEELERYREILGDMIEMGRKFVRDAADVAAAIAAMDYSHMCFVGAGPLAAVATESALKLLELTAGKVHTMSESVLGFRHGPMSALHRSTLFTQYISNDRRRQRYDLDLLKEIERKALAGLTMAVTPGVMPEVNSLADHVISLDAPPAFQDEYRPPLDVMFAQLLGLFSSMQAGLQPDCPSPNGAISRVVSHVQIYS
jgi:tagatose-6-phosphate ketose/aldose isomerase